jgi:hypothetical protein
VLKGKFRFTCSSSRRGIGFALLAGRFICSSGGYLRGLGGICGCGFRSGWSAGLSTGGQHESGRQGQGNDSIKIHILVSGVPIRSSISEPYWKCHLSGPYM